MPITLLLRVCHAVNCQVLERWSLRKMKAVHTELLVRCFHQWRLAAQLSAEGHHVLGAMEKDVRRSQTELQCALTELHELRLFKDTVSSSAGMDQIIIKKDAISNYLARRWKALRRRTHMSCLADMNKFKRNRIVCHASLSSDVRIALFSCGYKQGMCYSLSACLNSFGFLPPFLPDCLRAHEWSECIGKSPHWTNKNLLCCFCQGGRLPAPVRGCQAGPAAAAKGHQDGIKGGLGPRRETGGVLRPRGQIC
eukprot:scaffold538802_cov38-Prasinocladus_malaysianus.AAC.1